LSRLPLAVALLGAMIAVGGVAAWLHAQPGGFGPFDEFPGRLPGDRPAAGGDIPEGDLNKPPGEIGEATEAWSALARLREPRRLPVEPMIISWAQSAGDDVLFIRVDMPPERPDDLPGDDLRSPLEELFLDDFELMQLAMENTAWAGALTNDSTRRERAIRSRALRARRTLCRTSLSDPAGGVDELLDLGLYPHRAFIGDDPRLLAVGRQHQDTTGDGAIGPDDGRSIWVSDDGGTTWRALLAGSAGMSVAALVERRREVLFVEPGEDGLSNRILQLPIDGVTPETAAPRELRTGMYLECVDDEGAHAYISVAGRGEMVRRGRRLVERNQAEPSFAWPPEHFRVPLDGRAPEKRLALDVQEGWTQMRMVRNDVVYLEARGSPVAAMHPAVQFRHALRYLDGVNDLLVPITEEYQYDAQYLGVLGDLGVLYLKNTHITRTLTLYTGDNKHTDVLDIPVFTHGIALSNDHNSLTWLEYIDESVAPFDPLTVKSHIVHYTVRD
jgi:hypothetical protein